MNRFFRFAFIAPDYFLKRGPSFEPVHGGPAVADPSAPLTSPPFPETAAEVDRILAHDETQPLALEMYNALGSPWGLRRTAWTSRELQRYVKPRLDQAFRRGELLPADLYPGEKQTTPGAATQQPGASTVTDASQREQQPAAASSTALRVPGADTQTQKVAGSGASAGRDRSGSAVNKTWIQSEVVNEDGEPVANEPYRLVLTDGTTQQDVTDANGRIRVDGIAGGVCQISFPSRDAREWQPL